ncbi:MAG TPA: NAD(P)H-hydrate epimerase [Candidatus Limnocylindria bacterium]|nr:NAD(P)H-hydrate epimerase [Candidatus Limnocylindria bacterium]
MDEKSGRYTAEDLFDDLPTLHDVPSATAAQMADVDRVASAELGIPLELLMENASHQIAAAARLFLGGVAGMKIVGLAGSGNNGGDALGALRHLSGWGATISAVLSGPAERLRPLARRQRDILAALGVRLEAAALDADLLIDGLLGYSVAGPPRDAVSDLIRAANVSRVPILSVDLPSGLHPDTGEPLGITARAALTVTLALPKRGLMATRSRALVGELLLADIGIPPLAFGRVGIETRGLFDGGDLVRIIR